MPDGKKSVCGIDGNDFKAHPAAGLINIALLAGAGAACVLCLWAASQAFPVPLRILAAVCFSFLANTTFSLMHEAVHGGFHPEPRLNELGGQIAAAFFPTAFSLQRVFHLSHHRNNRSPAERFDYYSKNDNYLLKVAQWYGILTGLYWAASPVFCGVYAFTAEMFPWPRLLRAGNQFGDQTSARAFLESLDGVPVSRVRRDVALSVVIQFLIIRIGDVNLVGWCLCYGFFAINWSSLQYADHAFSSLDRQEGAWNLKVNRVVRLLFLNYHYHLSHHRCPSVSWMNLPRIVRPEDPLLDYWRVLLCMWTGPRPLPDGGQGAASRRSWSEALTVNLVLSFVFAAFFWLVYGSASLLFHSVPAVHRVDFAFEQAIPFVPWASLAYLTVVPFLALAPFVFKTPEQLVPFGVALVLEVFIAWWVFLTFPVEVSFPRPNVTGAAGFFYSVARSVALDGNSVPSLHVALTMSAAWAYAVRKTKIVRASYWVWAVAISASTILTHQHNVLDVVAGAALAMLTMGFVYPGLQHRLCASLAVLHSGEGVSTL